jgi:hypothetical protein
MREHVADRDALLPTRREFGPVGRHRFVVVEGASIGQAVDNRRGDALGGREAEAQGVGRPRSAPEGIGAADREVDHRLPVQTNHDRTAAGPSADEPGKGVRDWSEVLCGGPAKSGHRLNTRVPRGTGRAGSMHPWDPRRR